MKYVCTVVDDGERRRPRGHRGGRSGRAADAFGRRGHRGIAKGDDVLVYGQLVRRFYRSGAGARSLTEVVATGLKKLEPVDKA